MKKLFKESRPIKSNTYGLPSTKAATLVFIATYLILTNKLKDSTVVIIVTTLLLPLFMKYYSKEHSLKQLFIGGLVGLLFGYFVVKNI